MVGNFPDEVQYKSPTLANSKDSRDGLVGTVTTLLVEQLGFDSRPGSLYECASLALPGRGGEGG
jgi:hypothetical protein